MQGMGAGQAGARLRGAPATGGGSGVQGEAARRGRAQAGSFAGHRQRPQSV